MPLLYSLLLFSTTLLVPHDYHVGIYEMDIKNQRIEVTQKVFADDFKKALILDGIIHQFGDDLNEANISKDIQAYIKKHFSLKINGQDLSLNYVGAEWEDYHAFYLYWEAVEIPEDMNTLEIYNSVFLEVSEDQQNMHRIRYEGKEYEVLLDRSKTNGSIKF